MPDDDPTTPETPNDPGERGDGSRADERDSDGVDHAELGDSPMLPDLLGDPDVWFEHVFPDGDGFADWLDGSGFLEQFPYHETNAIVREIKSLAKNEPTFLWNKVLTKEAHALLQKTYAESLFGEGSRAHETEAEAPDASEPPEMLKSGWEQSSGYSVDVTMPDGSVLTSSVAKPGTSTTVEHSLRDPDGNVTALPDSDSEPVDAEGFSRRIAALVGGVVVATVVTVAVVVSGGGGDGDTSGATDGSPGDAPTSSTTSRSVVIQPCEVIDQALAASLIGTASPPELRGDDRSKSCSYDVPASAGDDSLSMFVTRNTAPMSGVFKGWRSVNGVTAGNRDVPIEIRTVPWTEDPEGGELRIRVFGTSRATVSLLAFVITSSTQGRVYVIVNATGAHTAGAAMATSVETIAEMLRDAVLAAQP